MKLVSGALFEFLFFMIPVLLVLLNSIIAVWLVTSLRNRRGVEWFVALLLGGIVWGVVTLLQATVPGIVDPIGLQYVGFFASAVGITCFAVFISKYTGLDFHRHPIGAAAAVTSVGGFGLALATNPLHQSTVELTHYTEPVSYVAYRPEPVFLLATLPLALFVVYSELALVRTLLSTDRRNGLQLALVLVGILSIGVMRVAGESGLFPAAGFSYSQWGFLPFVVCLTVALFWTDFLDVQPVARSAVVENLRDPVIVLDGERRVTDFNEATERFWPDIADQVGTPFDEAFPSLTADLSLTAADGDATQRVTMTADGQTRHFSVNVSRVTRGRDDDRALLSILLRDVTALEQSRWQLRKQNEQLDKVASTISHDLRNPINVADGYAELLADVADEEIPDPDAAERAKQYTDKIHGTHDRMTDIISDILTIAREGKTVAETERVALDEVAREAWGNVDTEGATLVVDDTRRLQADRSKLLTIFENLFRNSIEHGSTDPEAGSVTVTVGATADGFYVADDGPGIPEEHVAKLFEYGYTTTDEGTGLGLSIVETMAESHGWTVELDESAPGARFVFGNVGADTVADPPVGRAQLS